MKTKLLLLGLLLGACSVREARYTVEEAYGCNTATGDNLCTLQCKKDYPAPEGKEVFGKAGSIESGKLDCKCYHKRVK